MDSDTDAPLLASHGATFSGVVAEVSSGWRASAVLQLKRTDKELVEPIVGPKIFASVDAAQQWLQKMGREHGFTTVHVAVRPMSEADRRTTVTPSERDERGGTIWDRSR